VIRFGISVAIFAVLVVASWVAVATDGGWYTWLWAVLAPVGLALLLSELLPGGRRRSA
jgi:hypothetical protein